MGTTRQTRHSWPWRVDSIHGARVSGGQRQSGGLESAAIRRAWVSGDPAGLSQRWSGGHWVRGGPAGIESEAGRWRDLPWTARLGERQPGNQPAGLGEPPPAADISRDRRAWGHRGHWTRGTRGDPAKLPRPLAVGYGGITSRNQNKNFQNEKTKQGEGAPLTVRSGLLSRCTHEGGTGTRSRGRKLK